MSNRAKIFSPFAALRGYENEIASESRDHLKGNRIELSEEGKEALNQKISQLRKGQDITHNNVLSSYVYHFITSLPTIRSLPAAHHGEVCDLSKRFLIYTSSVGTFVPVFEIYLAPLFCL